MMFFCTIPCKKLKIAGSAFLLLPLKEQRYESGGFEIV